MRLLEVFWRGLVLFFFDINCVLLCFVRRRDLVKELLFYDYIDFTFYGRKFWVNNYCVSIGDIRMNKIVFVLRSL